MRRLDPLHAHDERVELEAVGLIRRRAAGPLSHLHKHRIRTEGKYRLERQVCVVREVSCEVVGAELVSGIEAEPPEVFRPLRHRRPPLLGETGVPLLLRERRERDEHVAAFLDRHPVRIAIWPAVTVVPHPVDLPRRERILSYVVRRIVVRPPARGRVFKNRTQSRAHELLRGIEQ